MATGDSLVMFHPQDVEPVASNRAQLLRRNLHPVLAFDQTTAEAAVFSAIVPRNYGGSGITVYVHWSTTVTSGTAGWTVEFERIGAVLDIDGDSFASAQTITAATVSGTSGTPIITNVAVANGTDMDSIAVGEAFRLRVKRDVANDTAAADVELLCVELKET